jgi:hypothetical protein
MVDLTIKKEMIEIISSMKGKTLKSIEGDYLPKYKVFMEFVRFNMGQFAVEVYSYEEGVKWFWTGDKLIDDEATCFTVKKADTKNRYYPKGWRPVQFLKDEKVSEIIIVRDLIKTNRGDEILVDSGFVVRTNENVYTFSKCDLSSYNIYMNESDKIDMHYSVKKAREDCSEPESNLKATVKRDYIFI